jgi:hypothetical protein
MHSFNSSSMCHAVGGKLGGVIEVDDMACIVAADAQVVVQGGRMGCLTGWDLTEYDYMSVGQDGFVPISIKLMTNVTRLTSDMV